jgi:phosphoribosyl 1,2-cyclic phosphodiesterase/ActR/RegA family two-component response regulator
MKKALLIDDARVVRTLIAQILIPDGWQVFEAEDGDVGLELAGQHRPDVVICDLLMPRCNGFQVCRSIRKNRDLQHTKIIVTSGRAYATDRLNALEAGAHEYLVKPVNAADLLKLVNRLQGPAGLASSPDTGRLESDAASRLRFWGVRGSVPTPGPGTVFFGGNTSCVEVRADDQIIVLDAGTGIRPLGQKLVEEFGEQPIQLTMIISHTHWDHIQGFPFFAPAYNPQNRIKILGFEGARQGLESILSSQMESPYFPIGLRQMPGHIAIEELKDLQFNIGKVHVQAHFVNHPGICLGYRLFTSSGSIAYLPDNEPFQRLRAKPETEPGSETAEFARMQDLELIHFIQDVDVLIMDSQYDAVEYQSHIGWGHGCVDDVVALALKARVRNLFLFHHDPNHDDAKISQMVAEARAQVAEQGETMAVDAAQEGFEFVLPAAARAAPEIPPVPEVPQSLTSPAGPT